MAKSATAEPDSRFSVPGASLWGNRAESVRAESVRAESVRAESVIDGFGRALRADEAQADRVEQGHGEPGPVTVFMAAVNSASSWVAASAHKIVTSPAVISVMSTHPGTSPRSLPVARRRSPPRTTWATPTTPAVALRVSDWIRFMRGPSGRGKQQRTVGCQIESFRKATPG